MRMIIISAIAAFIASGSAFALTGEEVYKQTCVACHGVDGKGAVPGAANFTDPKGPASTLSDKELMDRVIHGYQTPGSPMAMPPRGGNPNYTDTDLKSAVDYIKKKFVPEKKKSQ